MAVNITADVTLDTSKTLCPVPVIKAKQTMDQLKIGQVMRLVATDPGSKADIPSFARMGGHELVATDHSDKQYVFYLKKGGR
jgi:tRNA 2-thiouridine synthesizing protein A